MLAASRRASSRVWNASPPVPIENIIRAKEAELDFYGRVFRFAPADKIEPVEIENQAALPARESVT